MCIRDRVCADCGAVGVASVPCEGVPCRIAMEVQVQLADSPCEGASSHSWKMTDSYPVSYTHLDVYKRQVQERAPQAVFRL